MRPTVNRFEKFITSKWPFVILAGAMFLFFQPWFSCSVKLVENPSKAVQETPSTTPETSR